MLTITEETVLPAAAASLFSYVVAVTLLLLLLLEDHVLPQALATLLQKHSSPIAAGSLNVDFLHQSHLSNLPFNC